MRNLNKKQKNAIKKWVEDCEWSGIDIYTIDQMSIDSANKILAMNDHETFWQNADRFITDIIMEKKYG